MQDKKLRIFNTIIGFSFSLSILGLLVALVCESLNFALASTIVYIASLAFLILAISLMVIRFVKFGMPPINDDIVYVEDEPKEVKTVDVKPVEETPEQKLFKQYEELYKEKLITKEELEKKRTEILGK